MVWDYRSLLRKEVHKENVAIFFLRINFEATVRAILLLSSGPFMPTVIGSI